jgi:hypothetical protein
MIKPLFIGQGFFIAHIIAAKSWNSAAGPEDFSIFTGNNNYCNTYDAGKNP